MVHCSCSREGTIHVDTGEKVAVEVPTPHYSYIGKSMPRDDSLTKATGEAVYTTDIQLPGILFGKIKTSTYPFARILSINTDKARKLPGVKAVITAKNVVQHPFGTRVVDELALADKYVRYVGDSVAAVAANDIDIAEEAVGLIEVAYEELRPVFDAEKAMELGAPAVHPEREGVKQNITYRIEFERGYGESAFKDADLILEDRFSTQAAHTAPLEPQSVVAHWDTSSRLTLWASTQSIYTTQRMIATSLGIPEHQIRVIQPYIGGGFGGKMWFLTHHIIAVLLSKAAGRPVKIVYTRKEDFISGRPRVSQIIDLRMGFKKDGTMVAKSSVITANVGAYTGLCPSIVSNSATRPDCTYRLSNIKLVANLVYTNTIPRGAFRGFGSPQMQFAMESMIDMAAEKLGIDPVEIKLKNSSQKGDVTAHGYILNSCALDETIRLAVKKSGWIRKRQNKEENRGIGLACQVHSAGNRGHHPLYDGSTALVHMNQYGKAKVVSGESEIGQGMTTIFRQIAAEELGMALEDVEVLHTPDTDSAAFCMGTLADRVTVLGGNAVLMAARDVKRQLISYAAEKLGINAEDLEIRNSKFCAKGSAEEIATVREIAYNAIFNKLAGAFITGRGEYIVPDHVSVPDATGYGNRSLAYTFGTAVAEVSVDPMTGTVDILNIWFSLDIGRAINPKLCEGQVEGGVVQGIGYALSEDYVWDNHGRPLNPNFTDYKIPGPCSIPKIHCLWVEQPNPGSPYGAKGVGEPVINPIAPAIANAIYNAIGIRIKDLPITQEKILQALKRRT